MLKRPLLTIITIICVVIADQLCKWYMLAVIDIANRPPIEVTSFFNLVMVWNRGVSFGMFAGLDAKWFLIVMAVVISGLLLFWNRSNRDTLCVIATASIVGGAIGNIIDRLLYGAVADFFDFHVSGYHYPAFNIADMCVVGGVCLLLWYEFVSRHKHQSVGS